MGREAHGGGHGGEPLLKRLLRRRAEPSQTLSEAPVDAAADAGADAAATTGPAADTTMRATPEAHAGDRPTRIDPRSGKPVDELCDADLPPLDSIGPDSDVSAFMGRNISPGLRRDALRRLFSQPKFNTVCLCAEYAENYRNFTALGSVVPHDMSRQLAVQAERLARRELESGAAAAMAADDVPSAPDARTGDMLQSGNQAASTKVLPGQGEPPPEAPENAVDKS